jgi:hypothetical protein
MSVLASFLSRGVVIGFTGSINYEGVRKVTDHLLTMIKMGITEPNAMIYDSACNLNLCCSKNDRYIHLKGTPSSQLSFHICVAVEIICASQLQIQIGH